MSFRNLSILIGCCVLSSLLGVLGAKFILFPAESMGSVTLVNPQLEDLRLRTFASSAPTDFIEAAESVTPAVVFIRSYRNNRQGGQTNVESTTTGSAVIISPDGLIVTNNHVIEGARKIRITLEDRREYDAKILGVDESTDLALLKIEEVGLPSLMFGNSDSLRVGEWVLAVGNPFNLNSTVTTGIVSAKGRSIDVLEPEDRIESFIQTDAAVNPGNSGGALVNTNGELVGINTAILTNSGRHEGFAFAIPGNLASRVLNDLRDFGEVKRAVLGVYIQSINDAQAKRLKLDVARGALITNLAPSGPALRAGLEVGDVMTAINGIEINSSPEMQEQLSRYRPGQKIRITYIRNGRTRNLSVLLRDKSNRVLAMVSERSDDLLHRLGFEVRGLNAQERDAFPEAAVRVISVFRGSPIAETNMNAGFIITSINDRAVRSLDDFLAAVAADDRLLFQGNYEGYEGDYFYQLE